MPYHFEDDMKEKKETAVKGERIKALRNKGMPERDAVIKGLASMKRKSSEQMPTEAPKASEESYPYGLRLSLENEDLEKLGMTSLPDVGKHCKIMAEAVVESVSSNQNKGSEGSKRRVELQITKMDVMPAKESKGDAEPDKEEEV